MDWVKQSWSYIVLGGGFLAAIIVAVRNAYAAERDRQALRVAELEREKLILEIARLKHSPEVVADRRAIYDRLRRVLAEVMGPAAVELAHIGTLHEVRHDSEYRFPADIVAAIQSLIRSAVLLHVSGQVLRGGPHRMNDEEWRKVSADNDRALTDIIEFQRGMTEMFRPYLSLGTDAQSR